MVDIALLESLKTDIDVAPPSDYADSSTPNLLPEGTYNLYVKSFDAILDRDNPDNFKGFVINAEVVDGTYEGRQVPGLRVWAATYLRNGVAVSGLGDFIRAIDASAQWTGAAGAARVIQMAQDRKIPFQVKLGWEAFDQAKFEQEGGAGMVRKSPEEKALRKACTVKGMRNFPQNPDGSYRPETEDVEGNTIEARLSINNFIASTKRR